MADLDKWVTDFKLLLWEKMVVPLVGFELAETELKSKIKLVLNNNEHVEKPVQLDVNLRANIKNIQLTAQMAVISHMGDALNLPEVYMEKLIGGLIDRYAPNKSFMAPIPPSVES